MGHAAIKKVEKLGRIDSSSVTASSVTCTVAQLRGTGEHSSVSVTLESPEHRSLHCGRGLQHPVPVPAKLRAAQPATLRSEQIHHLAALERIPLFADRPREFLHLLAQRVISQQLLAGEILFIQGQRCNGLYILESGLIKLYTVSPEGREQVLATCGPGSTLSELPIMDGGNHPSCAAAIDKSSVLFISREALQALCKHDLQCALKITGILAERLRSALEMIEELSFATVQKRLAAYLLRAATLENLPANTAVVQLPTSQEIAAQIGTVRELVSRHLSRLRTKCIVRITGKTMQILDLNALAKEAAGLSHIRSPKLG